MQAGHCMLAGQCTLAEHCMLTKDIECWLHAAASFCECMLSMHTRCEFPLNGKILPWVILTMTEMCPLTFCLSRISDEALYFVPQPVFFAELLNADNHPILYEYCGVKCSGRKFRSVTNHKSSQYNDVSYCWFRILLFRIPTLLTRKFPTLIIFQKRFVHRRAIIDPDIYSICLCRLITSHRLFAQLSKCFPPNTNSYHSSRSQPC
jgi:hypothetical protein